LRVTGRKKQHCLKGQCLAATGDPHYLARITGAQRDRFRDGFLLLMMLDGTGNDEKQAAKQN
jgi:hypothetical protein